MNVLITGAAGFLGSHLCDRLLLEGHKVIGMDNFITGRPENLAHLADDDNFTFIEHDVSVFIDIPDTNLDAVMHFASPASPNPNSPYGYVNLTPGLTCRFVKSGSVVRSTWCKENAT